MTKLTRLTGKLFGETATATGDNPQIGQFGSGLAGTYVGTTDVATIQNLAAWSNGFISCVTPDTQYPPLPEMTGFGKVLSYQQNYLLQQGIAEWDSATTYYTNGYVSYNGKIYISLTDENLNNNPSSSTANWKEYGSDIFVHLTGNETISGTKTFSGSITTGGTNYVAINGTNVYIKNGSPAVTITAVNGHLVEDGNKVIDVTDLATTSTAGIVQPDGSTINVASGVISAPLATLDFINNSKALETGTASSNATILADVKTYAHSTFDVSKFTVVGTPTITDDGVASGFSSGNYITKALNITGTSYKIKCRFLQDNTSGGKWAFNLGGVGVNVSYDNSRIFINKGDTVLGGFIATSLYVLNDYIDIVFEVTATTATLTASCQGTTLTPLTVTDTFNVASGITTIALGARGVNYLVNSNIILDLKYFDVEVDGVPVFSGNKTGIDTIKPDDYTIVGTPTISNDGVVTSAGRVNHFTLSDYDYSKPFQVKFRWEKSNDARNIILAFNSIDTSLRASTPANNKYAIIFYLNGTSVLQESGHIIFDLNTTYDILFSWDGSVYSLYYKLPQNEQYTLVTSATNSTAITTNNASSLLGITGQYQDFTGKFDLNSFKIYVDGNLVYQPCLKIPYTESAEKYGSKIVNAVYRDRVQDTWEQNFPQRYYTLSDTDFTLPMGEIYGTMLNQSVPHIVETYLSSDGYTGYNLYSNGYCEQWCGSSQTTVGSVTLPKPYKDNKYFATATEWNNDNPSYCAIGNKTTTGFAVLGSAITHYTWYTCGYVS